MAVTQSKLSLAAIKSDDLIRRLPAILTSYGKALDQQLKEEIKTVQFPWTDRKTYRRNGTIEGTPRDIVDTGAFLRSQRRRRINVNTIKFTWGGTGGVTYAGYIYEGIKERNYPARDWIAPALKAQPIGLFFVREWTRLEKSGL
jgi:hypothetical protein